MRHGVEFRHGECSKNATECPLVDSCALNSRWKPSTLSLPCSNAAQSKISSRSARTCALLGIDRRSGPRWRGRGSSMYIAEPLQSADGRSAFEDAWTGLTLSQMRRASGFSLLCRARSTKPRGRRFSASHAVWEAMDCCVDEIGNFRAAHKMRQNKALYLDTRNSRASGRRGA
jgi:hypothetical protein